jgi:hypothetical protein
MKVSKWYHVMPSEIKARTRNMSWRGGLEGEKRCDEKDVEDED